MTTIVINETTIATDTKQLVFDRSTGNNGIEFAPKIIQSEDKKFCVTSCGIFEYSIEPIVLNTISGGIEILISLHLNADELVKVIGMDKFNSLVCNLQRSICEVLCKVPGRSDEFITVSDVYVRTNKHTLIFGETNFHTKEMKLIRKDNRQLVNVWYDNDEPMTGRFGLRELLDLFQRDQLEDGTSGTIQAQEAIEDIISKVHNSNKLTIIHNENCRRIVQGSGDSFGLVALKLNGNDPIDAIKFTAQCDPMTGYNSAGVCVVNNSDILPMKEYSLAELLNLIGD